MPGVCFGKTASIVRKVQRLGKQPFHLHPGGALQADVQACGHAINILGYALTVHGYNWDSKLTTILRCCILSLIIAHRAKLSFVDVHI